MKKILSYLLAVTVVSFAIVSCKDNFNERDFLTLQSKLKLQQDSITRARDKAALATANSDQAKAFAAALNEAGELLGVTILVRENNVPVAGVVVTLSSGADQTFTGGRSESTQAVLTATSGADGNAVFDKVQIGKGTLSLSKAGLASATASVDFGSVSAPTAVNTTINGVTKTTYLPPVKRFESVILPVFSKTGGNTATVKGKVTIETDFTNRLPEIPQGLTLQGNFTALVANPGGFVTSYVFDNGSFGTATVDNTTGEYSMVVPASVGGYNFTLIVPTLELDQKIAINGVDGVNLATGPEVRTIKTQFGPNIVNDNNPPFVPGALAVFPPIVPSGAGATFSFTPYARSLPAGAIFGSSTASTTSSNVTFRLDGRGSGYTSGPTVTISGGGGTGATANAAAQGYLNTLTVGAAGTGYTGTMTLTLYYTDASNVDQFINSFNVTQVSGGLPSTITVPGGFGFKADNQFGTSYGFLGLKVLVTGAGGAGATVTPTYVTELNSINITNGGSGFSTTPTFVFTGGGATTQATMTVTDFRTQWTVAHTGGSTTPYKVMPSDIDFVFPTTPTSAGFTDFNAQVTAFSANGVASGGFNFLNQCTVSGGNIVNLTPTFTYRTSILWPVAPSVSITDNVPALPVAAVSIDNTTGKVTGLNSITNFGKGYDTEFGVTISTITGAAGTGATVKLVQPGINPTTKENTWTGSSSLTNGGSGYASEVNQYNIGSPNAATTLAATSIPISANQTYILNYNYDRGKRKTKVQ